MSRLTAWLAQLLQSFRSSKPVAKPRRSSAPAASKPANSRSAKSEPAKPVLQSLPSSGATAAVAPPNNLDSARHRQMALDNGENELLEHIAARIERGDFELPHLPATSLALLNLAGKPNVDVQRVVQLVSTDPSLASELLRIANSVLFSTHMPAETIDAAIMRIGLRGLRSLVFSVSMKGVILRFGKLQSFSEEIWRQAFSVASIARTIAPLLGVDRERAFLVGLLHDIGKIALLAMLAKELKDSKTASPALVGRVFYTHHERAGALLCEKWRLDAEITAVAGNHHHFNTNEKHKACAALASLAHKLDLFLSFDDPEEYRALVNCDEFEALDVPQDRRESILSQAARAYELGQGSPIGLAA